MAAKAVAQQVVKQGIDNTAWALFAPIITWPGGEQDVPDHLRNTIQLERLALVATGESERATEAEVVAYLMTASLANPMSHDWAQIYLHTASKYLGNAAPKEFSDKYQTLEPHQKAELDKLRKWIRTKQNEALKARRKGAAQPR